MCVDDFTPNPYVSDPVGWVQTQLNEYLWSKQREIMESIRTNRYTAVQSCHGAGKSFVASRSVSWWLSVHPPGDAFAVTTAPTAPQVSAILWREIRKAHRKGQLQGYVTSGTVPEWKLDDGEPIGYGRKPADTDQAAFQGIHARFPLIVVDEACGVPRMLFDAVDSLATNEDARVLAIGNPDDPSTHFNEICKPGSGWNVIRIDALASPLFTAEACAPFPELVALMEREGIPYSTEHVPADLLPMLVSPMWVNERILRWGAESPIFTAKVRGLFPDVSEDTLITPKMIREAQERHLDPGPWKILGVDVARFGSDRTVFCLATGGRRRIVGDYSKLDTTETTGKVLAAVRKLGVHEVRVDGVGVGGGVVDQLAHTENVDFDLIDMQAGGATNDPTRFANARAEWYWHLRELFENDLIDIDPADDQLAAQLGVLKFEHDGKGRIKIESKDSMKRRGLPSPDRADVLMIASAAEVEDGLYVDEEIVDRRTISPV